MKFLSLFSLSAVVCSVQAGISQAVVDQKAAEGLRLVRLAENEEPVWKTDDEVLGLIQVGTTFMDVTETYSEDSPIFQENAGLRQQAAVVYPNITHQDAVKPIIATLQVTNLQTYLANLTAFNNRYYRVQTGEDATQWILKTVQDIIAQYPTSNATAARYAHSFIQGSVIAKIPGTTSSQDITIVGCHLDSINARSPTSGRAPGADDNGYSTVSSSLSTEVLRIFARSGTVNLIEAFRALLASGFKPSTPVEFHWYAGEEGGLLGSQDIAKSYYNAKKVVKAMLQYDMTAYVKPGDSAVVALMPDYVDATLNTFVKSVIAAYLDIPAASSAACGYACSDHASWYQYGYPTTLPHEAPYGDDSQVLHTTGDTSTATGFSFTHMHEFSKLLVGFIYELTI
ncbi:aminopeptidase [Flagelloscypha sp. PMI_526]|nr:aminopeptidase [Flagelloscypha sp. PMI_526]